MSSKEKTDKDSAPAESSKEFNPIVPTLLPHLFNGFDRVRSVDQSGSEEDRPAEISSRYFRETLDILQNLAVLREKDKRTTKYSTWGYRIRHVKEVLERQTFAAHAADALVNMASGNVEEAAACIQRAKAAATAPSIRKETSAEVLALLEYQLQLFIQET